jgi:hypothetical protein
VRATKRSGWTPIREARALLRHLLLTRSLSPARGAPVDLDALTHGLPHERKGRTLLPALLVSLGVARPLADGRLAATGKEWESVTCRACGCITNAELEITALGRVLSDGAGGFAVICVPCSEPLAPLGDAPAEEVAAFLLARRTGGAAAWAADSLRKALPALPWERIQRRATAQRRALLSNRRRMRREETRRRRELESAMNSLHRRLAPHGAVLQSLHELESGWYLFAVATPVATHIDEGTAGDIVRIARRDAAALRAATCPFCGAPVRLQDVISLKNGSCPSCQAIFGIAPAKFGALLARRIATTHGQDGLWEALARWEELHRMGPGYVQWFDIRGIRGSAPNPFRGIQGPDVPSLDRPETERDIEVLTAKGGAGVDDPGSIMMPSCSECLYCLHLDDWSTPCVMGVDGTPVPGERFLVCTYPLPTPLSPDPAAALEPERMRGRRQIPDGTARDQVMARLRNTLPLVGANPRAVARMIVKTPCIVDTHTPLYGIAPGGHRVDPICPRFALDPSKLGGLKVIGTVPVRFNVPDTRRRPWEGQVNRFAWRRERALHELERFKAGHRLGRAVLQASDPRLRRLIKELSRAIPRDLLSAVAHGDWEDVLRVSPKAADVLCAHFKYLPPSERPPIAPLDLSAIRRMP